MKFTVNWLLLPMVLNLCTCGGRTECVKRSKLAVIANLQTKRCENNVNDFFYTQDADNNLSHKYNFDYKGLTIDSAILPVLRTTLLQLIGNVATHQNVCFLIARLVISHTDPNILKTLPEDCIHSYRNIARNLINISARCKTLLLDYTVLN
ncbi:hypothetical protein TSAR_005543 [Trichomalopsis sarcophagae]|uniref:Uncharacterized protein n=1 Tax=Trichomalopsis sarcophagae TaxID=543379 RepID=A0A232FIC8_9HYME|nr:hypothetical protein TSAR_005543 [Trichomalopsis sarcophagae]